MLCSLLKQLLKRKRQNLDGLPYSTIAKRTKYKNDKVENFLVVCEFCVQREQWGTSWVSWVEIGQLILIPSPLCERSNESWNQLLVINFFSPQNTSVICIHILNMLLANVKSIPILTCTILPHFLRLMCITNQGVWQVCRAQ